MIIIHCISILSLHCLFISGLTANSGLGASVVSSSCGLGLAPVLGCLCAAVNGWGFGDLRADDWRQNLSVVLGLE